MSSLFKAGSGSTFQRLPEGNQVVRIKAIEFDPDFFTDDVVEVFIVFENQAGITHKDRFNMATEGGLNAMTYTMKVANNNFKIEEGEALDPYMAASVGRFIDTNVVWEPAIDRKTKQPITTKKGDPIINVRLNDKKPTKGWGENVVEEKPEVAPKAAASPAGFNF